jgi:hypothetical protein
VPEASGRFKEQLATTIKSWNSATANKEDAAAAEKNNWGRQEILHTQLRRRSCERMGNKDLAMAGVGNSGISPAFCRSSSAGGVFPTSLFSQKTSKFEAPAQFDRNEAGCGGGGIGGRSLLRRSSLLPFPKDGDSISVSRFSAGSCGRMGGGGGISFRAQNPFDNRGFSVSCSSALDNLSQLPSPLAAFSSPSGGSGGVTFCGVGGGGREIPFDDYLGGGNPFDRRRSRFDEPPLSQIQRPGVWKDYDQVSD